MNSNQNRIPIRKISILCCILMIFIITGFSQKNSLQVWHEKKKMGTNFVTGFDITGSEYVFPNDIHRVFFDAETNIATVQIKGRRTSGNILQYDMNDKKILWSKKIDYEIHELIKCGNLLILNEYNNAFVIDNRTGENVSKIMNYIYFANPKYNIGVAYFYIAAGEGYYTNDLMGIDLLKGNLLWKRTINRAYGWNDFFFLNDSTLLVAASGLHTINIKNGTGWDYQAITGVKTKPNYTGAILGALVGGLIGGAIGGLIGSAIYYIPLNYAPTLPEPEIISFISSNTLIDSTYIYFASQEQLAKLDVATGDIVWEYPLPKEWTSKSSIFMDDEVIYMINHGFAIKGGQRINYGKPFIASFNKKTGEQIYLSKMKEDRELIIDFKQMGNEIYLLSQYSIAKYNLETGTMTSKKTFPKEAVGELRYFLNDRLFVSNNSGYFSSITQNNSSNPYFYTSHGKVIAMDNTITKTTEVKDFGFRFFRYNDYNIILSNERVFITDKDGKIVAELDVTPKAFIINGILFDKRESSFIAIDLKNTLPNN